MRNSFPILIFTILPNKKEKERGEKGGKGERRRAYVGMHVFPLFLPASEPLEEEKEGREFLAFDFDEERKGGRRKKKAQHQHQPGYLFKGGERGGEGKKGEWSCFLLSSH